MGITMLRWISVIVVACIVGCVATSCRNTPTAPSVLPSWGVRHGDVMGCPMEIKIYAPQYDHERILDLAEDELRRIDDMMTTYRDSPLSRLNRYGKLDVPKELGQVVRKAQLASEFPSHDPLMLYLRDL